ncbi:MAG: hypothetical protein MH252_12345 [Thermosynechococcaceae cyanobacterium MS004]|nr:hypothetical protein [Thermosynechococcaceae cyanobacterium MS004]
MSTKHAPVATLAGDDCIMPILDLGQAEVRHIPGAFPSQDLGSKSIKSLLLLLSLTHQNPSPFLSWRSPHDCSYTPNPKLAAHRQAA